MTYVYASPMYLQHRQCPVKKRPKKLACIHGKVGKVQQPIVDNASQPSYDGNGTSPTNAKPSVSKPSLRAVEIISPHARCESAAIATITTACQPSLSFQQHPSAPLSKGKPRPMRWLSTRNPAGLLHHQNHTTDPKKITPPYNRSLIQSSRHTTTPRNTFPLNTFRQNTDATKTVVETRRR